MGVVARAVKEGGSQSAEINKKTNFLGGGHDSPPPPLSLCLPSWFGGGGVSMTWQSFIVISKFGGHVHTKLGNVLSPSHSPQFPPLFTSILTLGGRTTSKTTRDGGMGPSPTFVHRDFGPRRRDNPRSINFDAKRRSCVKKRTDDATGRQWGRGMEGQMAWQGAWEG